MTKAEYNKRRDEIQEELKKNLEQAETYQRPGLIWKAQEDEARLDEEFRANRED